MMASMAYGLARWMLKPFSREPVAPVHLDLASLSEPERQALRARDRAELYAIEVHTRRGASRELGQVEVVQSPSLDTPQMRLSVSPETGQASYSVMSPSLRDQLGHLLLSQVGSLRGVDRLCRVVGHAGEEAFAAHLVEKLGGVRSKRVLGYSSHPARSSRFGLTNKSGQGVDMLVKVPPPPQLRIQRPKKEEQHWLAGMKGITPTHTLTFQEETLLVIEVKATLGGEKTPRFNKYQAKGDEANLDRVLSLIRKNRGAWAKDKLKEFDPEFLNKLEAIRQAKATGKIEYLHAQVFFDSKGALNPLVGEGSGIQLNRWD